jgi:hypothetical protein
MRVSGTPRPSPRHCEPTGRANARPMTGSAKQSTSRRKERMDCFAARDGFSSAVARVAAVLAANTSPEALA